MPKVIVGNRVVDVPTGVSGLPSGGGTDDSALRRLVARVVELELFAPIVAAGAPAGTGTNGQEYWDTTSLRLYRSDGTGWIVMAEPNQADTTLCLTGINADGGVTSKTNYRRENGEIWVESESTFASGPSTLASLAWVPPKAGRAATGNVVVGIGRGELEVTFFDDSGGTWYQGDNNEGTTSINLFASADDVGAGTSAVGIQAVTTTVPFAFTTNDKIRVIAHYPMATRYT